MKSDPDNPGSNALPKGLSEEALGDAITSSGYPLQGVVANQLQPLYSVAEEWGYIDRDTKDHRALDVYAYRSLTNGGDDAVVTPSAVLLIECKRSTHPLVFFRSTTKDPIPRFPKVLGARRVQIRMAGQNTFREVPPAAALGLDEHPYVTPGPPRCASFSKAVPKGKGAKLSGADSFNNIVLPLVKAYHHAADLFKPGDRPERLHPTITGLVCVLDAPMILIDDPAKPTDGTLSPWIRVFRREATPDRWNAYRFYALDVVHAGYFDRFLAEHFNPFSEAFAQRARTVGRLLLDGAQVANLDDWTYGDLQPQNSEPKDSPGA